MKKMLIIIWTMIFLIPIHANATIATSTSHNYLNIYLFCNDEESSCKEAKEELTNLVKKDDDFSLEYLDITLNKDLFQEVRDSLNVKDDALPLIVIGSSYFTKYDAKIQKQIEDAIQSYHENSHCDLVNKLKNKEDIKDCLQSNADIYVVKDKTFQNNIIYGSIIGISILILGIVIYFIFRNNKKCLKCNRVR